VDSASDRVFARTVSSGDEAVTSTLRFPNELSDLAHPGPAPQVHLLLGRPERGWLTLRGTGRGISSIVNCAATRVSAGSSPRHFGKGSRSRIERFSGGGHFVSAQGSQPGRKRYARGDDSAASLDDLQRAVKLYIFTDWPSRRKNGIGSRTGDS